MILIQRSQIKKLTSHYSKAASFPDPLETESINLTVKKDFVELDIFNSLACSSLIECVGMCRVEGRTLCTDRIFQVLSGEVGEYQRQMALYYQVHL